jgi:hypothetical protein
MDALALALAVALPWSVGCAALLAARWPVRFDGHERAPGRIALVLGYGYFIGVFILTAWMRVLSAFGLGFGRLAIGAPLLIVVLVGLWLKRSRFAPARLRAFALSIVRPPLPKWQQIAWAALLAWFALRFATLAIEVASRPLYPWDAFAQWAPKARVWYALGRMAPFVPADAWLGGASGAYFDAAPASPATVPLLQAWGAIALGHWDDSAINWPWLFMLAALALAVYGMLRDNKLPPLGALTGAYVVASLPLLDAHVALAGYPDLLLTGAYTLSALAVHRWALKRDMRDAALAALLALSCLFIDVSGSVWLITLVPGAIVAVAPGRGLKLLAWLFAAAALALLALAGGIPVFPGVGWHFASPWRSLAEGYFLRDNWHLLWYGAMALAIVGAPRLLRPPIAALTAIVASALAWLLVASMFSQDIARWIPEATVINRASLHVAPLVACVCMLLWRELTVRQAQPAAPTVCAPEAALAADA